MKKKNKKEIKVVVDKQRGKIPFSELTQFITDNYMGLELLDVLERIDWHTFPEDRYVCQQMIGVFTDHFIREKENKEDRDRDDEEFEAIRNEDDED